MARRLLRGQCRYDSRIATIKGYYDYGMFQAIQIAAIVALRDTEAAVERQSMIYQGRRDVLVDGLHRIGWEATPPRAGMFVWARVPEKWRNRMSTLDFAMMLLEEGDVAVSPGSGFGPAGEGYLRMALVENENRLRQPFVRSVNAWNAWKPNTRQAWPACSIKCFGVLKRSFSFRSAIRACL